MAGTTFSSGPGRSGIVGINVTPMVDIVLVLLVIMMVSANFIVSESMNVDLPKASNGDRTVPSTAIVTIQADGSFGWHDKPVTEAGLVEKLKAAFAENPDTTVVVSADGSTKHSSVVHVIDLAKAEGITHYAIGVEKPD